MNIISQVTAPRFGVGIAIFTAIIVLMTLFVVFINVRYAVKLKNIGVWIIAGLFSLFMLFCGSKIVISAADLIGETATVTVATFTDTVPIAELRKQYDQIIYDEDTNEFTLVDYSDLPTLEGE